MANSVCRRRVVREVEGAPCRCTPEQMCLFHYDQLDPGHQATARRRVGVRELYVGPRR